MPSCPHLQRTNRRLDKIKVTLEKEKFQREALLGRQYELISCFAQDSKMLDDLLKPDDSTGPGHKEAMAMGEC